MQPSDRDRRTQSDVRFDALLVGHAPGDPPEATLVLAAAAAFNGLLRDGAPMPEAVPRPPSLRELADELGLHVGAVRRGVRHLEAAGAVRIAAGVRVDPEALRTRWAQPRQRLRLTRESRRLGLRAEPLLLVALVAGQMDARGQLRLGLGFLGERTGLPRRTLQRALERAEDAGALHRWIAPVGGGRLVIALGPSRNGARRASRTGARRDADCDRATDPRRETAHEEGGASRREPAPPPVAKRRTPPREAAHPPSRNGARHPEYHPDVHPDHPPDARADAREQTPAPPAGEPSAEPREPAGTAEPRAAIEAWVVAFARRRIEHLTPHHAGDVAGLLDQLGPRPVIRDRHAWTRQRLALAQRIVARFGSPERLGRWLLRVTRWFGVHNLGGYLRRSVERGDPGTVLEGATRARVGRGAATWRDFSPPAERALAGPYAAQVAGLVAAGATALAEIDPGERDRLRVELGRLIASDRIAAARTVLLRLVGDDRSDVAIARAVAGICSLDAARRLLAA